MTTAKPMHKLDLLYREVNKLRLRDGLEPVGGLGFAAKIHAHFHESENPRVAEALRNTGLDAHYSGKAQKAQPLKE